MGMMIAGRADGLRSCLLIRSRWLTRLNLHGVTGVLTGIACWRPARSLTGWRRRRATNHGSQISIAAVAAYGTLLQMGEWTLSCVALIVRHCRPEMGLHPDYVALPPERLNGGSLPTGDGRRIGIRPTASSSSPVPDTKITRATSRQSLTVADFPRLRERMIWVSRGIHEPNRQGTTV